MTQFQCVAQKAKPGLSLAGKLALLAALRFGPAGVAAWVVKSVTRRPLKMVLVVVLEPLLTRILRHVSARYDHRNLS